MAAVRLLAGGEQASYSYVRDLWREFDSKLSQMLSGKSFLVGQFGKGDSDLGAMSAKLMGKCFFFTSGDTRYVNNAPGFIADGGGARNYDHTQFELALAAVVVTDWDEVNKVANIERVDGSWYAGLPQEEAVGYFEHSLSAHYQLHTGAGDAGDVPYYVREAAIGYLHPPPEKKLRYGLAEILLEGVTALTLPAADKYDCYRLHNLNLASAVVTLPGATEDLEVTLAPLDCRTVRRKLGGNFELTGWKYFFPYRGGDVFPRGDPRLPWFLPTKTNDGATSITQTYASAAQGRAANSMGANNLANPSLLLDWVNHFDPANRKADYAPCLYRDRDATGAEEDIYARYAELFGDPGDPETLLGDLLHHKGRIVIIRRSKTETDPLTSQPVITRDEVMFNGYATIVADFAAKLLSVTEDVDGNLVIDSDDPDNDVDLIPIGTNLFKAGEESPTIVTLPHTIEAAIFETTEAGGQGGYTLSETAPNVVQQRSVSETTEEKNEYVMEADGDIVAHTYTATDTEKVLSGALTRAMDKQMAGIHSVTVADLLDLSWWGDAALGSQDTDYVQFENARLLLTWEGLVLRFTEAIAGIPNLEADYLSGRRFGVPKERRILFRGHGWPYHSETLGGWTTGWLSPRKGRFTTTVDYEAEEVGIAGADFAVTQLGAEEQDVRVLRRLRMASSASQGDGWLTTPNARFWHARFMDNLLLFLEAGQTDAGYWAIRGYLLDPRNATDDLDTTSDLLVCMALLPEHFNALATTVNSLTTALPLNAFSLRWVIDGDICWLPEMGRYSNVAGGNPVPITEWTEVPVSSDSNFDILLAEFGVTVRDKTDLPPCPDTLTVKYNINEGISITADNFSGPDGSGYMTGDLHLSLSVEDNTEWYYSTANPLYPTDADLDPFRYIPVGGPNMQTGYDDYNWVTIEDIKTTFGQWGIPVLGVQVCKPLNLVEFSRADATFNWSNLGPVDDSFSIIADVIPDPLPSLAEGNDNFIPLETPENYKSGLMFAPAIIRGEDSALWKTLGGVAPGNQIKTNIDSVGDTQLLIQPGLNASHPIITYTGSYNLGLEALWVVNPPSRDPDDWPANYAWWWLQLPYDDFYNTLKNTVTWGIISENCRLTVALVKRNYWERPVSWVDAPSFCAAVYADDIPWTFTAASGVLERITSQPGVWTDVKPTASQPFWGDGLYDLTDVFISLT